MSDNKRRMNRWIPAVIMGVVAILFAFYALQSQADLMDVRAERDDLKRQLGETVQAAARMQKDAENQEKQAAAVMRDVEQALEECLKSKRK